MSDVAPQCWECKHNPCKWYNEKERLDINSSIYLCEHYEEADFVKNLYKDIPNE